MVSAGLGGERKRGGQGATASAVGRQPASARRTAARHAAGGCDRMSCARRRAASSCCGHPLLIRSGTQGIASPLAQPLGQPRRATRTARAPGAAPQDLSAARRLGNLRPGGAAGGEQSAAAQPRRHGGRGARDLQEGFGEQAAQGSRTPATMRTGCWPPVQRPGHLLSLCQARLEPQDPGRSDAGRSGPKAAPTGPRTPLRPPRCPRGVPSCLWTASGAPPAPWRAVVHSGLRCLAPRGPHLLLRSRGCRQSAAGLQGASRQARQARHAAAAAG